LHRVTAAYANTTAGCKAHPWLFKELSLNGFFLCQLQLLLRALFNFGYYLYISKKSRFVWMKIWMKSLWLLRNLPCFVDNFTQPS